jgi:1-acyl-sn-glycerol-3-phosphate acyltransferase
MFQEHWYHLGRSLVAEYARWVLKADIRQAAPLPDGPKILVANHPSTTDPAWVSVLVSEQSTILIKEILFKVPLFGKSLQMSGHIPVAPGCGKIAFERAVELLRAGRTVIVFPEGEISPREGGLLKAHTGAARLALATGAPVIPVGIGLDQNHLRVIPARVDGVLDIGYWYLHGPYAMTVGAPLRFSGNCEDRVQVHTALEEIMGHVSSLSHESALRVRASRPVRYRPGHLAGNLVGLSWQLFGSLFYKLSSI